LLRSGVVASLLALPGWATAAEIKVSPRQDINVITLSGEIRSGDNTAFPSAVDLPLPGKPTVVMLDSPGGDVLAALAIGALIHDRGWLTGVGTRQTCASACALIWLAGSRRFASETAQIGFHGAYNVADHSASSVGNALVGAYLNQLGLSLDAIAYITEAKADEMQWLTPADGLRIGLLYRVVSDEPIAPPKSREQMVKDFILHYHADWSAPGADASVLAKYYASVVEFYGKAIPIATLMAEKEKFSQRWPTRHYTVKPETLYVTCEPTICAASGVVSWDVASPERNARSIGEANFVLKVSMPDLHIVSENGAVMTHTSMALQATPVASAAPVLPNALTEAYQDGRNARIAYEQWFSGLPDGAYKDGATFWAANRSVKPTPPCTTLLAAPQGHGQVAGCLMAQAKLAPSDVRRLSEPDFKAGWNSL
jgi:ATP-dependent protease ClpP protease subunit